MSWSPTLDGVPLDTSNGIAIDKLKDTPVVKLKLDDILSDGNVVERYSRGGRKIVISGTITAETQSSLETRIDTIVEKFTDPNGGYLSLKSTREIFVYGKPGSLEIMKGASNLAMDFSCEFRSEDPFWRTTTVSSDTLTITASTGTLTVTNGGSAPVRPLIKVIQKSGTAGVHDPITLSISNLTLDKIEYIRITGAALGNTTDKIVLDPGSETVYLENDTSSSTKVPLRMDGTFPQLQSGANLLYFDTHSTGSNLTFTLYHYAKHFSSGY